MCCSDSIVASGFIRPSDQAAQRALGAIEARRWGDAAASVRKIPDSPLELFAWKSLLNGAVLLGQSRLTEALAASFQAAGCAFAVHYGADRRQDASDTHAIVSKENPCDPRLEAVAAPPLVESGGTHAHGLAAPDRATRGDALRLAAMALTQAGKILRRLDRVDDAYALLETALRLREQYGSAAEQWESSVELGLAADLARRHDEAESWFRRAIERAAQAGGDAKRLQAEAWGHLARSYGSADRRDAAVDAARRARDLWREHDPGAAEVLLAEMQLAGAMLARLIVAHESGETVDGGKLDEAVALFDSAAEGLPAFGAQYEVDARWAIEQKQFAERLRRKSGM